MKSSRFFLPVCALLIVLRGNAWALGEFIGLPVDAVTSTTADEWYYLPGEGPDGEDCISSGSPPDGGTSALEYTVTGPGMLAFEWAVSSEAGHDYMVCEVSQPGGFGEVAGITGTVAWQHMEVFVPAGQRKVRWNYRKDAQGFAGEDSGRLAKGSFTPLPAAAQDFAAWQAAYGIAAGASGPGGLDAETMWLMGLNPAAPVPAGLLEADVSPGEIRFRVRYSRAAEGFLAVQSGDGTGAWTARGHRSRMVPGSAAGATVDFDIFVPAAGAPRRFVRCMHSRTAVAPEGYAFMPSGTFMMSSPAGEPGRNGDENYQHEVTLTRGFFIRRHETTYAEWMDTQAWARANGYPRLAVKTSSGFDEDMASNGMDGDGSGTHPVSNVNWYETIKWLNAKSERDGRTPCYRVRLVDQSVELFRNQTLDQLDPHISALLCDWDANGYRLPSEAEWEYACRAGTDTALSNGPIYYVKVGDPLDENLDKAGWYAGNSGGMTHPVGQKDPNPLGLYDMHGNIGEWCWDAFRSGAIVPFPQTPVTDPRGGNSDGHIYRIYRGGGWKLSGQWQRSASRSWVVPTLQGGNQVGFRYCRNAF